MSKKTMLYRQGNAGLPSMNQWHPYLEKYFKLEVIDTAKTYNKQDCFLWVNYLEVDQSWATPYIDSGYKIVSDYLWDHYGIPTINDNVLTLKSNNWILANESIWYKHQGYDKLQLARTPDKFLLCLMNAERERRTQLFDNINKYSSDSLISYVAKGVHIAGDIDVAHGTWQRFVNTDWYNSTSFSLVAETSVDDPKLISEKIFKPMAFKHPFVVWGPYNILNSIKKLGFRTFSHVIDESYDDIVDADLRLHAITKVISSLRNEYEAGRAIFTDSRSLAIIEHNYNLFYNKSLIEDRIIEQEILQPILEFVNE
jgi:hypothetical protein